MVGPSKILTVSYGTFSCTLEGFDEPFSTMKAIAEYFRDLAADDRYFGAEPPTPDAEMLHRIAEREIQRRVEAKINEHGIVLRQTETATAPVSMPEPVAAPITAPVAAPVAIAAAAATALQAEPAAATDIAVNGAMAAFAPEAAPAVAVESAHDTTLSDFEEAALQEAAPPSDMADDEAAFDDGAADWDDTQDAAPEAELAEADVEAAVEEAPAAPELSLEAIMAQAAMDAPEMSDADADMNLSDDDLDDDFEDMAPAAAAVSAEPEPDSIAAKLMRIRAVVEDVRAGKAATYDEEEAAAPMAPAEVSEDFAFDIDMSEDSPELLQVEAERAAALAAASDFDAEEQADIDLDDDQVTAAGPQWDDEDDQDDADEPAAVAEAMAAEAEDLPTDADVVAAAADEDLSHEEPAQQEAASEDEELLSRLSSLKFDTNDAIAAAPAHGHAAATPEEVAENKAARFEELPVEARAADEGEQRPSFFERARATVIRLAKPSSAHPAEDEAEQAAADEYADDDFDDDDFFGEAAEAASEDGEPEKVNDVTRLMEEAKSKLEGAETRRRFSAISHLKAAVAATLADRKMVSTDQPKASIEAQPEEITLYREDLSKAVRPRRPAAEAQTTTARPTLDMRPAPLVLVSEQRIDRPEGSATSVSVRPRRVAANSMAAMPEAEAGQDAPIAAEDAENFAHFAEQLGAVTLTDLLEAAAAYTASVEGLESFSRPQLLRKVEFVSTRSDYSREDGLRSFGTLLREGKIQKVGTGRFTINDSSKFMSEMRKAM